MNYALMLLPFCFLLPFVTTALEAQAVPSAPTKNEVGLVIGATLPQGVDLARGGRVSSNADLAFGLEYDRHLVGRRVAVSGGVDFLVSPSDVTVQSPAADVSPQYAYLFLTPHVRVKFSPDRTIQPWLLFGGGYANFAPAQPRFSTVNVQGSGSTGTFEFGGGVDTKPLVNFKVPVVGRLPIGARLEVRDFYSGTPNFGVETVSSRQNFLVYTGGLVLHF